MPKHHELAHLFAKIPAKYISGSAKSFYERLGYTLTPTPCPVPGEKHHDQVCSCRGEGGWITSQSGDSEKVKAFERWEKNYLFQPPEL